MTAGKHGFLNRSAFMATRGLGRVLSPAGSRGRLAVFCYHQVLQRKDPLRSGEPTVDEFENDIEIISQVFTLLPLREAAARMAEGTLPARAACITFDDGYRNNHELAAPILEKAGVPATFFVTGGALDDGVMWNDLVIAAFAREGEQPRLGGVPGLDDLENLGSASGSALLPIILERLKYQPVRERWAAAQEVYCANVSSSLPRLMMTRDMAADLSLRGFEIGGHTLRHPILQAVGEDEAREEIEGCSRWIQEVTGQVPACFAYPNGKPGKDFGELHQRLVADAGFELAVSTDWRLACHRTNSFSIPRIGPWWRQHRNLVNGFARVYLASQLAS